MLSEGRSGGREEEEARDEVRAGDLAAWKSIARVLKPKQREQRLPTQSSSFSHIIDHPLLSPTFCAGLDFGRL